MTETILDRVREGPGYDGQSGKSGFRTKKGRKMKIGGQAGVSAWPPINDSHATAR